MKAIAAAKQVAAEYGITLTDEQAEDLVWEKTGFPCFFSKQEGEKDGDVLNRQLREALAPSQVQA
jgi:hypothetical protein